VAGTTIKAVLTEDPGMTDDYATRRTALETDDNPFATVVLAHLAAQATRQDPKARLGDKLALTKAKGVRS